MIETTQFNDTLTDIVSTIVALRKAADAKPDVAESLLSDLKKLENEMDNILFAFDA